MTAHRYWRIYMTAVGGGNAYAFSEVQFRTTAGVPLLFSGGTVSVSSSYNLGTNPPSLAIDNNINTWWAAATPITPAEWWAYDYGVGNALDIVEIMLTSRNDGFYNQTPTTFIPQYSDNGTTWTSLMQINATWSSSGQTQTFAARPDPGYANPGGTGNRTALIIVTTTAAISAGSPSALVDGTQGDVFYWNSGQTGREVRFDFSMFGAPRCITEATWYQSVGAVHGNWKWQGSNDGSSWTDIGVEFALGTSATQVISTLSGNTNFWKFYRMLQTAGSTSNSPWLREIEFAIDNTVGLPHAAMLTQIAVEEWVINNPSAFMTQIALEQWASVGGVGFFSARHV